MTPFDMGRAPPVIFGSGRIAEVAGPIAALGGGPVLIVADAALAEFGMTARLEAALEIAGVPFELAALVSGEPKEALVDALTEIARSMGAKLVIGFGGGAAMDAAKLVAAIAPSGDPAAKFAVGGHAFPANGLPAIAIPTTAGTGSEVTRTSIVSTKDGVKNWYWGEELGFDWAILDAELTVSLPANLTAWTGIDAIAHALEAATSRSSNAPGRLYGFEALRLLAEALPRAVADGDDLAARQQVLWASTVAGLALHNCNAHMGHNISHALGSLARIHHGLATGLALEVSLPWLVARPEGAENYAIAAEALGGPRQAGALAGAFAAIMRACRIDPHLPPACAEVSASALAISMKHPTNRLISQNAACPVTDDDLDEMAAMMMRLPLANAA
ncbi:MAG: iron-containing alcohol dehydrogenase [Pseudomonadota bacterium]